MKFYNQDAGEFMSQMAANKQSVDVVFMDPPRAGSDERFLNSLCYLNPKNIVYISCNPVTLERDLKYLTKKGYQVNRVIPVDMFSWTAHVEWEQEAIKEAIDVIENWDNYNQLPDKYEINEYRIMERYCYSIDDEKISDELCYAISGRGAFRRFKDAIVRYNLEDNWNSFRHKALCKVAKEWCEDNDITFVEE